MIDFLLIGTAREKGLGRGGEPRKRTTSDTNTWGRGDILRNLKISVDTTQCTSLTLSRTGSGPSAAPTSSPPRVPNELLNEVPNEVLKSLMLPYVVGSRWFTSAHRKFCTQASRTKHARTPAVPSKRLLRLKNLKLNVCVVNVDVTPQL